MSTVNPLPGPALPGSAGNGDTHQQRWLQDLERAWLRSWQQAEPAGAAAAPGAMAAPSRPAPQGMPAAAVAGPKADERSATGVTMPPHSEVSARAAQGALDGAARWNAAAPTPQAAEGRVQPISQGTPLAVRAAGARTSPSTASQRAATPPTAPPSTSPSAASLHLREPGADGVMAALRDGQLDTTASQAAAESLARQLALAGYAKVQVYVNGMAARRQPNESQQQPPSAVHREEQPPHGH